MRRSSGRQAQALLLVTTSEDLLTWAMIRWSLQLCSARRYVPVNRHCHVPRKPKGTEHCRIEALSSGGICIAAKCRMLRQLFCANQLRSALDHGRAIVRDAGFRASGTAFPSHSTSSGYLTRRLARRVTIMATSATEHRHTNRLAKEQSPYLLQHQYNPVSYCNWM
jgi:hypothetical protein